MFQLKLPGSVNTNMAGRRSELLPLAINTYLFNFSSNRNVRPRVVSALKPYGALGVLRRLQQTDIYCQCQHRRRNTVEEFLEDAEASLNAERWTLTPSPLRLLSVLPDASGWSCCGCYCCLNMRASSCLSISALITLSRPVSIKLIIRDKRLISRPLPCLSAQPGPIHQCCFYETSSSF